MASQDLVGRPLVPFFDGDDNLNELLQLGDNEREEMDVDARVWDKELGYFVYPADREEVHSDTIANVKCRTESGSKLLLTPSMMLSSNAPDLFSSVAADGNSVRASTATDDACARSNSIKRGSRQKSRPIASGVRQKDKEEGVAACTLNAVPVLKKTKSKGGVSICTGVASRQLPIVKQQEQLSDSGKWAWSAFQSSPDPTELPIPPFLSDSLEERLSVAKASISRLLPTSQPSQLAKVPIAPPLPPEPPLSQPSRPTVPPEALQKSVEFSMTQDLRRMLNIAKG